MKHYTITGNGIKKTFKTKAQALIFATIESNKIKVATGQKVRFKLTEN